MLRLERKSKGRPPSISLRENSRLLTPNFLKALGVALGIHLSGLVIFQIHPFFIRNSPSPFPPVQVNIEMLQPNSAIFAELQGEKAPTNAIAEPQWAQPIAPSLTAALIKRSIAYPSIKPFPENTFTRIVEWRTQPLWPEEKMHTNTPLTIIVSGPLGERELTAPKEPEQFNDPRFSGKLLALYDVKVEDQTGKIIWHQCKTPELKKKLRVHSEKILEQMEFAPIPAGFLVEGVIEIAYDFGKGA